MAKHTQHLKKSDDVVRTLASIPMLPVDSIEVPAERMEGQLDWLNSQLVVRNIGVVHYDYERGLKSVSIIVRDHQLCGCEVSDDGWQLWVDVPETDDPTIISTLHFLETYGWTEVRE